MFVFLLAEAEKGLFSWLFEGGEEGRCAGWAQTEAEAWLANRIF